MSSLGMPDPMAKRLGYALKRAQHALRTRMDEALRHLDLTTPQYAALSAIELDPGISSAALARAAFVTPPTMQGIVTNLERAGLLKRSSDLSHGRILRSELTRKGVKKLQEAHVRVEKIEAIAASFLSPEEIRNLAAQLIACADAFSAANPSRSAGKASKARSIDSMTLRKSRQ